MTTNINESAVTVKNLSAKIGAATSGSIVNLSEYYRRIALRHGLIRHAGNGYYVATNAGCGNLHSAI